MCGIAGALSLTGQAIDPAMIGRMASVQAHRGPDGEGAVLFSSDGCFTRVVPSRIGDASSVPNRRRCGAGASPARHHRPVRPRRAADGRRRRDAAGSPSTARSTTTSSCMAELRRSATVFAPTPTPRSSSRRTSNGDRTASTASTACSRSRSGTRARRLFCARDRLGIKPFYYARHDGQLLFASEPKGILAASPRAPSRNLAGDEDYSGVLVRPVGRDHVQGHPPLPPASMDDRRRRRRRRVDTYWNPSFDADAGTRREDVDRGAAGAAVGLARACRCAATCRSASISRAASIRARSAASPHARSAAADVHRTLRRRRVLRRDALCPRSSRDRSDRTITTSCRRGRI